VRPSALGNGGLDLHLKESPTAVASGCVRARACVCVCVRACMLFVDMSLDLHMAGPISRSVSCETAVAAVWEQLKESRAVGLPSSAIVQFFLGHHAHHL